MTKRILITGVSRGLGQVMTAGFIKAGHTVYGCARNPDSVAELTKLYGHPHQFAVADVADDAQVQAWSQTLLASQAAPDLLINNAGLVNHPAPLWEISAAEFSQVIDVNIKGTANIIRHFLPAMIKRGKGIVVNFSSGWGRSTSPDVAPYCATKWAVEGLTRSLAQELPKGMAAVALNPGIIHTDMLETCYGEAAAQYTPIEAWGKTAVPFLLGIKPSDNGTPLTVPSV
ncbi:MAG: SDR family oxidoreductase [Cyanobacteria bacterium P01_A01_bin.123]